jgi:cytochrome c oxidase subunit III
VSEDAAVRRWRSLAPGGPVGPVRSAPVAFWAMGLAVATEAMLFACFVASYFFLRWQADGTWPPEGVPDPKLARPSVLLGLAVLSGATMLLAHRAVAGGRRGGLVAGLTGTIALGLAFVGIQVWDWAVQVADGTTPQDGAYSSLTFLLTGAHTLHLAAGVLILGWILARALRGAYDAERRVGVAVAHLYWQFVVALAVTVYLTVYISPLI